MTKRLAGLLLATLLPLAAAAQEAAVPAVPVAPAAEAAPPAPARPGYRGHTGFFLRPEAGYGYLSAKESVGGDSVKISGGAIQLGAAVGGSVTPNFVIAGQVWTYLAPDPSVTVNIGGISASGTATDTMASLTGVGVLFNWYLQPSNVYLSFAPSLTKFRTTGQDSTGATTSASTDWGFGVRGSVGKEWWVGGQWGLGLAGSLAYSANKDGGSGAPTLGTLCLGVTFSATLN